MKNREAGAPTAAREQRTRIDGRIATDTDVRGEPTAGGNKAAIGTAGEIAHRSTDGDPGFAIYFWDCSRGAAAFPTLDVFLAPGQAP